MALTSVSLSWPSSSPAYLLFNPSSSVLASATSSTGLTPRRPPPAQLPCIKSRQTFFHLSHRGTSHIVRMAPDVQRLIRRNPVDFPLEWERPKEGRRPDVIPQFSPMKAPLPDLPPPTPFDPTMPDEGEFEEEFFEDEEDEDESEDEYDDDEYDDDE